MLSSYNIEDVIQVKDLAVKLRAKTLILSNLIPMTEDGVEKILYTKYENKPMKEFFNKLRNEALRSGLQVKFPNCELKTERHCSFVENNAMLLCASGDIVPCMRFSHNYNEYVFGQKKEIKKYSFGNINNGQHTLKSIWESPQYTKFRETIYCNLYTCCLDCDLVDSCDFTLSSEMDCNGFSPGCSDCLWSKKIAFCI